MLTLLSLLAVAAASAVVGAVAMLAWLDRAEYIRIPALDDTDTDGYGDVAEMVGPGRSALTLRDADLEQWDEARTDWIEPDHGYVPRPRGGES